MLKCTAEQHNQFLQQFGAENFWKTTQTAEPYGGAQEEQPARSHEEKNSLHHQHDLKIVKTYMSPVKYT